MPRQIFPSIFTQTLVPKGAGWPIKISYLYFVTFFIVMPLLCFRLKNSPLNHFSQSFKGKDELRKENDQRLQSSDLFISTLSSHSKHDTFLPRAKSKLTAEIDIQLMIVTISRNRIAKAIDNYEPKYLTQSYWRFSTLIQQAQADGFPYSIRISACNVDPDPSTHSEAHHMSKLIHMYTRFNKTYTEKKQPKEKEKDDYIYCIREILKSKSKYALMVEDDGYPTDDFIGVLQHTMDRFLERKYTRGEFLPQTDHIAFVKFYHAEWVMGFINLNRERLLELLGLGLLLGTILTLMIEKCYFLKKEHLFGLWMIMIVYAMLVSHCIGRVNIMEFHRLFSPHLYSYVPAPACCIPGILYTAEGARNLADYLEKVTCTDDLPKDMAIGRYVHESGVKTYQVQPNTFLHIGAYSLVREKFDATRV